MKKMKKVFGILLVIFSSLFCVTSCYCFFAAVTGKLEVATLGETLASAMFFAVFAMISACVAKFGGRLWKEKKNSKSQNREIKPFMMDGELLENERAKMKKLEFWNDQGNRLKPFLLEDRIPFAAYSLERIYYEKLQNCANVERFYYVPNDAPVQLAIRKYQADFEWRKVHQTFNAKEKEHSAGKDSVPPKVHIRVSSEKSLKGCDNFYYEQCLKAGMHIVMYTGPYTLLDVTEGREYQVRVKTVNDNMQAGGFTGEWLLE